MSLVAKICPFKDTTPWANTVPLHFQDRSQDGSSLMQSAFVKAQEDEWWRQGEGLPQSWLHLRAGRQGPAILLEINSSLHAQRSILPKQNKKLHSG